MKFDEYQEGIVKFDTYEMPEDILENLGQTAFLEKVLGLAGESGETLDKIKKILRDKEGKVSDEDKGEIVKELGDVLWYGASVSRYLGVPLSEVAEKNVEKLTSRLERNKIHGTGDNR